ncbi:putative cysteine-rich receptor-like protein kinase 20 [Silene latifolia]|uniref:putative cysteine-rich receptor-like protein kinase 20 n=1 Tax=Silene latifolia TaxID=37657 RepID=UPI003D77F2EC
MLIKKTEIQLLLCLSVLFFCKQVISEDQVTFLREYCSDGVHYNQGNTYQSNLNLLLTNFTVEAASKKFYNFSIGEGLSRIEGIFLCNGAYTSQVCSNCITVAAGQIQQKCPNNLEAIVWYGQCMLRYANRSILSVEDDSVYFTFDYGPLNYKKYNPQLSSSLIDLSNTVTVDNSPLAFANGVVYAQELIWLTTYVECTPDLTRADCKKCLQTGLNRLEMDGIQLRTIVQPSCRLSYFYLDFSSGKGFSSSSIALIAVAAIAGTSLIANLFTWFRKAKARGKPTGLDEMESIENLHLQFKTIKAATDNFAPANKIGRGGFGVVYMGTLPDGQAIAVKRLDSQSGQGIKEFKSEACLVAKLQHKNLVKLYGFCLEGEENLLVYEFVPNKSLDRYLFDTNRGAYLKWQTRKKILLGIGRGLVYLHEDSRIRIIHRDLKPSNILLDEEMNPKIADFGMAKLFGNDQTQGNTSRVAGTFGYMAPEYATTGHFSVKSDVFSFGVILLEVVSGRRNNVAIVQEDDENLLNYAWRLWSEGAVSDLVDPNIKEDCPVTDVTRCVHIALLCIQEDAARRPTITMILSMLSNESVALAPLTAAPAFPYRRELSKGSTYSNAIFTEAVFTDVNVR